MVHPSFYVFGVGVPVDLPRKRRFLPSNVNLVLVTPVLLFAYPDGNQSHTVVFILVYIGIYESPHDCTSAYETAQKIPAIVLLWAWLGHF